MKRSIEPIVYDEEYVIRGKVEIFPQADGWHFVKVPIEITRETKYLAQRGFVAIDAKVGVSKWKTSLLPMGEGKQFVPLPIKVRQENCIKMGDNVEVRFRLRER